MKEWKVTLSTNYGSKVYAVTASTKEQAEQVAREQAHTERDYSLAHSGFAATEEQA